MKDKGRSKTPYVLGGVFILGLVSLGIYIWYNSTNSQFPVWKYILSVGGTLVGLTLLCVLLFFVVGKVTNRSNDSVSSPKEMVSTTRALRIWKEEFLKDNQIPYLIPTWKDKEIEPCNPEAIVFRNIKAFTDPLMQTADRFVGFEVEVYEGRTTGSVVSVISLDLGEKFIRENWNMRLQWNTAMSSYKPETKSFPLTTNKNAAERLANYQAQMLEEGYSKAEILERTEPFLKTQSVQSNSPLEQQPKARKSSIKSPDVTDIYPQYRDEETDQEDLEEDQEAYRRAKQ